MTLWRLSLPPGLGSRNGIRRRIHEGLFDTFHENLRLARPRHALYPLLLRALLHGCGERDHWHICLLRCALAHSAEEGFAYTVIQSGCEEQHHRRPE